MSKYGMDDNRFSLIHEVEAERHEWACTTWKIPSRPEALRNKVLLTETERRHLNAKYHQIWQWLNVNPEYRWFRLLGESQLCSKREDKI